MSTLATARTSAPAPFSAIAPIGLLGGSFDPVHTGHLQLAAAAQAALGLAQVVFLPAGQPWQKGAITAASQRVAMLELALGAAPEWRIDTCEIARAGPSYTIDTLQHLRADQPRRPFVWILGFDQLRRLPGWHRWEELSAFTHFAYTRRPGADEALDSTMTHFLERHRGAAAGLAASAGGTVVEFSMEPVDCSSTQIRAWLGTGQIDRAATFLSPPVLDYIRDHQLYGAAHG